MANSATPAPALPFGFRYSHGGSGNIIPVNVVVDTADTDLTVFTPIDPLNHACIVGAIYAGVGAHVLTLKSGTTTLVALDRPTNGELYHAVGSGLLVICNKGDALVLRSSANIAAMLLYVTELRGLTIQ